MLSRLTRPAALATVSMCALAVLTACADEPEEKTAKGFDAVAISGEFGEVPEFDWKAGLERGKTETEILKEGDGDEVKEGDKVLVNLAVSNDFTQDVAFDTFGPDRTALVLTVGEETEPAQAADLITQVVADNVDAGMRVGTRIAIAADVEEEWGDLGLYLTALDIGNEDGIAIVADLVAIPLAGPEGRTQAAPGWSPKVVLEKGIPTAIDSTSVPKPDVKGKEIRSALLIKGTGPEVEKGEVAVVNYLGQTWGANKPFDGSFERGETFLANIGETTGPGNSVIEAWTDALIGVPTGSRVIVEIPPAKGYGKEGHDKDIKGDDILYFVIDVLAAG